MLTCNHCGQAFDARYDGFILQGRALYQKFCDLDCLAFYLAAQGIRAES
jgi:hypothetical protein